MEIKTLVAKSIAYVIDDFLAKADLKQVDDKCVRLGLDGCSTTSGKEGGVQEILRKKYKKPLYFYSSSHKLIFSYQCPWCTGRNLERHWNNEKHDHLFRRFCFKKEAYSQYIQILWNKMEWRIQNHQKWCNGSIAKLARWRQRCYPK